MTKAKEDLLVLHPGPMNRGVEIVAVRMAIYYTLMGGREE